jgi:hypothetical protein
LIIGIQHENYLTYMGTELFMTQESVLMLKCLLLSAIITGLGHLLGWMNWWKFSVNSRILPLVERMFLFGSQRMMFIHVLRLGIVLDPRIHKCLGVMRFGFCWPFLVMHLCFGWCLGML